MIEKISAFLIQAHTPNNSLENMVDWVIVGLLWFAGWVIKHYQPEQWTVHLVLLLTILKIAHQIYLFFRDRQASHKLKEQSSANDDS